jgi:RimK family alpha-L-glutamate ligase
VGEESTMTNTRFAVLGTVSNETNPELVEAWRALGLDCELVEPAEARRRRADYDAALARLDVLPTLDGVEPGLLELYWLERNGCRVHNSARALLSTHDKLRTAVALRRARVPHPPTTHLTSRPGSVTPSPPVVLKPRFGSWGRDVRLCQTRRDVQHCLDDFATRPWFRRHGVLVQEVVPSSGRDLRVLVARRGVVGAIERLAAAGEWRTNTSVGGTKRSATPSRAACNLALAAVAAVGADLVGVDLLPLADGGYTVIELNGAADFDDDYSLAGGDVYADAAVALGFLPHPRTGGRSGVAVAAR